MGSIFSLKWEEMLSAQMEGLWGWVGGGLKRAVKFGTVPEETGSDGLQSTSGTQTQLSLETAVPW